MLFEPPRRIELAMLPFLRASPEGRRFLAAPKARALARGEPAEMCPALGVSGGESAPDAAARSALAACVAELDMHVAPDSCACRLLALDDTLLADRTEFAYAQGVSARLLGLPAFAGLPLVAEEAPGVLDAERRIHLRGPLGPVGELRIGAGGRASLSLVGEGRLLLGRSKGIGWRRGRLAEVVRLGMVDDREVALLVGLEPEELAALAED